MVRVGSVLGLLVGVLLSGCVGGDGPKSDGPTEDTLPPGLFDYVACDFRTPNNTSIACDNSLTPIVLAATVPNGWICVEESVNDGYTMALYRQPVQRQVGIRFTFEPVTASMYIGWVRAEGPEATVTNRIVSETGAGFGPIPGITLLPDQSATVVVRVFDLNYTTNNSVLADGAPDPILHLSESNDTLAPDALIIHRLRLSNATVHFSNLDSTPFNVTGRDFQLAVNLAAHDYRSEGRTVADGLPPDPTGAC